jgi:hypothetical protein
VQAESMTDRRDRVLDWRDELRRLTPLLLELPAPARRAVMDAVAAFVREDEDGSGESLLDTLHGSVLAVSDAA